MLVASTAYPAARGTPASPEALHHHCCLALERHGVVMNEVALRGRKEQIIQVTPAMVCDDEALLRQWALKRVGDRR